VGRRFGRFSIWKFRSMRASNGGPRITAAGDERVTRVGRVLRATKLDELPQFWNVLRGEMSLVGPRPEVEEYVRVYEERFRRILEVRPGITDLASIAFRDEEAVLAASADPQGCYVREILPAKLALAEEYVAKRTLGLDFLILARTAGAILR
jgi:lipopolysaccharide/colanic/teichoic acid biosynthesis glycosyltransferase